MKTILDEIKEEENAKKSSQEAKKEQEDKIWNDRHNRFKELAKIIEEELKPLHNQTILNKTLIVETNEDCWILKTKENPSLDYVIISCGSDSYQCSMADGEPEETYWSHGIKIEYKISGGWSGRELIKKSNVIDMPYSFKDKDTIEKTIKEFRQAIKERIQSWR